MCVCFVLEKKEVAPEPGRDTVPVYVYIAVAIIATLVLSLCVGAVIIMWVNTHIQYIIMHTQWHERLTANCVSIVGGGWDKWRSRTLCSPHCLPEIQFLQWWWPKKTRTSAPSLHTNSTSARCFIVVLQLSNFSGSLIERYYTVITSTDCNPCQHITEHILH